MHCPFCGNTLSPSARICYNCGHEFLPKSDSNIEGDGGCFTFIISLIITFLFLCFGLVLFGRGNLILTLFN
jgi:uncharacterized OB-fold protein